MLNDTVRVEFSLPELWLMRGTVRHAIANEDQWKGYPPANVDLNDQIAAAILRCEEYNIGVTTLDLSRGDCLVIDFNVNQDAKDREGNEIGKELLLKTFKARKQLRGEDAEWPIPNEWPDGDLTNEGAFTPEMREKLAAFTAAGG